LIDDELFYDEIVEQRAKGNIFN